MALALKLKTAPKTVAVKQAADLSAATEAATEYRNLAAKKDEIEAQMEVARESMMEVVSDVRLDLMRGGENVTSLDVPTSDGNRVKVVYQERWSLLSDENIPALKASFGNDYNVLVEEAEEISLRKGLEMVELEKALGKTAFAALQGFLEVKKGVKPAKGANGEIARLFARKKANRANDLLTFCEACAAKPQVRAK